jgi:hypothetical protein
MRVENMKNQNGNEVPNQFIITNENGDQVFQSYKTTIALKTREGRVYLDENYWNYSRTTIRYRNIFLNASTKEIKEKIKSGEYELVNLNSRTVFNINK